MTYKVLTRFNDNDYAVYEIKTDDIEKIRSYFKDNVSDEVLGIYEVEE